MEQWGHERHRWEVTTTLLSFYTKKSDICLLLLFLPWKSLNAFLYKKVRLIYVISRYQMGARSKCLAL